MFDLAAELERLTKLGYAPQILYDDDGNWAVTDEGFSSIPTDKEQNFQACYYGEAEWFKPTPEEAWKNYLTRLKELGNNV